MVVMNTLRQPWKKRLQERAEKTAMKQLERELREAAEKERAVSRLVLILTPTPCFVHASNPYYMYMCFSDIEEHTTVHCIYLSLHQKSCL